jgi:mannose-6-phosphate isomerase-like protein (cupin superfamily)
VAGGKLVGERVTGPDQVQGTAIEGGTEWPLQVGDMFYIPANTPHLWKVTGKELFVDLIKVMPKDAASDQPKPLYWSAEQLGAVDKKLKANLESMKSSHEDLSTAKAFTSVIVHRDQGAGSEVEVHEHLADFHLVRRGEGTMALGGKIIGGKTTAPGEVRGASLEGAAEQRMRAGDLLYVPAGTPHQFQNVPGQEYDVLVIKIRTQP